MISRNNSKKAWLKKVPEEYLHAGLVENLISQKAFDGSETTEIDLGHYPYWIHRTGSPSKGEYDCPSEDNSNIRCYQLQRTSWGEYIIEPTKTNAGTRKLSMIDEVFQMLRAIIEDRPTDFPEIMVQGYAGFLFRDKNGMPEVAMHWEHRFNHAVKRYNDIFKVQMPNITPHVCRHTYCSNMARARMNPKTLQYLMGIRTFR